MIGIKYLLISPQFTLFIHSKGFDSDPLDQRISSMSTENEAMVKGGSVVIISSVVVVDVVDEVDIGVEGVVVAVVVAVVGDNNRFLSSSDPM